MSVEFAPHCWKDTSFADPEYVIDFTSPNAFCALAITVFASCAIAVPHRNAMHNATTASFFDTVLLLFPPYSLSRNPVSRLLQICRLRYSGRPDEGHHESTAFRLHRGEWRRRAYKLSQCVWRGGK